MMVEHMEGALQNKEKFQFPIPRELLPEHAENMFPMLTGKTLQELARNGWKGIGIGTVVVKEDGGVLILEHSVSLKAREGEKGIMGETLKFWNTEEGVVSEQVPETLTRALSEELELSEEQISELNMRTENKGAWRLTSIRLGENNYWVGIVLTLLVDDKTAETLSTRPKSGSEVRSAAFVPGAHVEAALQDPTKQSEWRSYTNGIVSASRESRQRPQVSTTRVLLPRLGTLREEGIDAEGANFTALANG